MLLHVLSHKEECGLKSNDGLLYKDNVQKSYIWTFLVLEALYLIPCLSRWFNSANAPVDNFFFHDDSIGLKPSSVVTVKASKINLEEAKTAHSANRLGYRADETTARILVLFSPLQILRPTQPPRIE